MSRKQVKKFASKRAMLRALAKSDEALKMSAEVFKHFGAWTESAAVQIGNIMSRVEDVVAEVKPGMSEAEAFEIQQALSEAVDYGRRISKAIHAKASITDVGLPRSGDARSADEELDSSAPVEVVQPSL